MTNPRANDETTDNDQDEEGGRGAAAVVDDEEEAGPLDHNDPSAFDEAVVRKAVSDAGQFAFGIVMVEVWLLSQDQTRLYRPSFGYWVDPVYASSSDDSTQQKLARLTDSTRRDFVPTTPLAIGEGLAGLLWVEAKNQQQQGGMSAARNALNRMRHGGGGGGVGGGGGGRPASGAGLHRWSSEARMPRSASVMGPTLVEAGSGDEADGGGGGLNAASGSTPNEPTALKPHVTPMGPAVFFRNVNQISSDPDQPFSPRLRLIADLGLGWCVAVPMFHNTHQGLVLYLARNHVSLQQLQSTHNQSFLVAATNFIGAAVDLREPRRQAELARRQQVRDCWGRLRDRILYLSKMGISMADAMAQAELEKQKLSVRPDLRQSLQFTIATTQRIGEQLSTRFVMMLKKSRGGGGLIPPPMSTFQSCYSFAGAFVTLTILHFVNLKVKETYDTGLALGPFGALVTMMYSLSSAPASQPRNAILGQALSVTIGLAFSYATTIPTWLRVNLATSFSVALMSKFAIIHPPAGGAAFLFATGVLGWGAMLVLLVGYVITLAISMLLNNWSVERQYPIYWGVPGANIGGASAMERVASQLRRRPKTVDNNDDSSSNAATPAAAMDPKKV